MARAKFVKKARKAVPSAGIEVGDSYYWWKFRHGGKHYSKTAPRPSQLTNSDKLSRARACAEALEDIEVTEGMTLDELRDSVNEIASQIEEVAQEYRDSVDNMPEGLQQGSVAEECNEKADELENWQQEVESCLDSLDEAPERDDYEAEETDEDEDEDAEEEVREKAEEDYQTALEEWMQEARDAISGAANCPI